MRLSRIRYVIGRLLLDIGNLSSRALNALVFNGSTAQTFSARAYADAASDPVWDRRRRIVDRIFFWQEDHCRKSWEREVERARYVLSRLERI
jgi:hypothetical protein